jgi:hypothetical protein
VALVRSRAEATWLSAGKSGMLNDSEEDHFLHKKERSGWDTLSGDLRGGTPGTFSALAGTVPLGKALADGSWRLVGTQ